MTHATDISQAVAHFQPQLQAEIMQHATTMEIAAGTEILREGQYIKVIPIVISGLIKVFSRHHDRELLLYYITPSESCIMSFSSSLKNDPSPVFAIAEENTTALLLPVDKVARWIREYPDMNTLFFQQFNQRYSDLLDTINHVLFNRMDVRLFDFLNERATLTGKNPLRMSHRQIATELGTAREVISRVMKKLENEGKVKQLSNGIKIL